MYTDWFECAEPDRARYGGKGASLIALRRAGFPVPAGFCVPVDGYRQIAALAGIGPLIDAAGSEAAALRQPEPAKRLSGAIDRLAQANAGKRIGIFCHGGVINVYLSVLLGSAYDQLFSVHHTSVTTLRAADDRRAILTINDFSHVFAVQDSMNEVLP